MRKTGKILASVLMTLAICIAAGAARPAAVQAANKVLKVSKLSFSDNKAQNRFRGAEIMTTPLETDKLTKKSMKLSGKIYIPAKAFKKAGDEITISPELSLWKFPPVEENNNAGVIYSKYDIILQYTADKKIVLYKQTGPNQKRTKAGKYAAVVKEGSWYLVTIKNAPITGDFLDENDEPGTINTKKEFILNPGFGIFSTTKKAWKGTILVDDVKLKSATKTQTVTFNKKDYQGTYVTNWASGNPKASVVKK